MTIKKRIRRKRAPGPIATRMPQEAPFERTPVSESAEAEVVENGDTPVGKGTVVVVGVVDDVMRVEAVYGDEKMEMLEVSLRGC